MINEQQNKIINDILNKELDITNCIILLLEQGYIPNKAKEVKLQWYIIFLNIFKNINIFNETKQQIFINKYIKIN